jgi:hypothetical protein
MKTIQENEVLNDFEEHDEFMEGFFQTTGSLARLDLNDPHIEFPQKVLDAYNTPDEQLLEDMVPKKLGDPNKPSSSVIARDPQDPENTIENAPGFGAGYRSGFIDGYAEAHRKQEEAKEKLKFMRYQVEVELEDMLADDEMSSDVEIYRSRQEANKRAMALFQSWLAQGTVKASDWVKHRGYANANETSFDVDTDGCLTLCASRHNDEWNLRVQASKFP